MEASEIGWNQTKNLRDQPYRFSEACVIKTEIKRMCSRRVAESAEKRILRLSHWVLSRGFQMPLVGIHYVAVRVSEGDFSSEQTLHAASSAMTPNAPRSDAPQPTRSTYLLQRIIEGSSRNIFMVLLLTTFGVLCGIWALTKTPLDATPDLSDVQVIVYTDWEGRSPDLVEDQVTYPISTKFIAAPKVKFVRGESMFGKSFVYVIFEDGTDIYWARSRVIEYLNSVRGSLPEGVNPVIGPDATGVGWVYEYALVDKTGKHDLAALRSVQDWHLRYALESVPGVAEVASVGGFVKEYQIDLDPNKLLAYGIPISDVVNNIRKSNGDVGGKIFEAAATEYYVRGRGYIRKHRRHRGHPS